MARITFGSQDIPMDSLECPVRVPTLHHLQYLNRREYGLKYKRGTMDKVMKEVYGNFCAYNYWNNVKHPDAHKPGAVFNLEFSDDGSILVAACKEKSLLLFDSITQKNWKCVEGAHNGPVNGVRFLNPVTFATYSDDRTIHVWDVRNLSQKARVLAGHLNWVKSVEYSRKNNLIVSSAFDGSVLTWDMNNPTEQGLVHKKVFHTNGLMRMRLSHDGSKMVISTTGGYMMIVHDLDLESLSVDFEGFKPNLYRLMQISDTPLPIAARFTRLFDHDRKRNRMELISDFPEEEKAEIISSLQLHPHGWCALSRNITTDQRTEWTTVHDIQAYSKQEETSDNLHVESHPVFDCDQLYNRTQPTSMMSNSDALRASNGIIRLPIEQTILHSSDIWEAIMAFHELASTPGDPNGQRYAMRVLGLASGMIHEEQMRMMHEASHDHMHDELDEYDTTDSESEPDEPFENENVVPEEVPHILHQYHAQAENDHNPDMPSGSNTGNGEDAPENEDEDEGYIADMMAVPPARSQGHTLQLRIRLNQNPAKILKDPKIQLNRRRLLYFIEESHNGRNFIKELCFSADGRIIASPYQLGVRLLQFGDNCEELYTRVPATKPAELKVLEYVAKHSRAVLCSTFSPRDYMLVTGCKGGEVVWYRPQL